MAAVLPNPLFCSLKESLHRKSPAENGLGSITPVKQRIIRGDFGLPAILLYHGIERRINCPIAEELFPNNIIFYKTFCVKKQP
jgi:hypothetical protein